VELDNLGKEDKRDTTDAIEIAVREHKVFFEDEEFADLVMTLQERKREVLLLSEVLDYTLDEIASELNLAYETVKSTKSKALRELRKEVVDHYGTKD
jgi:RNA polymerase sigma factor (sigma-70 family)